MSFLHVKKCCARVTRRARPTNVAARNRSLYDSSNSPRSANNSSKTSRRSRHAPPTDVHPEAVEAALAAVPDLREALYEYGPAELAQLFEDFDVEVEYDKHERLLRIAATLALDTSPETARPPRGRSHNCDIAGERFVPGSDARITQEYRLAS
jgi:hypothetical protein